MKIGVKQFSFLFVLTLFIMSTVSAHNPYGYSIDNTRVSKIPMIKSAFQADSIALAIYTELADEDLNFMVFLQAYHGYLNYKIKGLIANEDIITLIDFDKNSMEKRLFILDLKERKVLYNSYVAHGQASGELDAEIFSNRVNSHQSSLGFYLTDNTYTGKHGLSLRLDGLEKGVNDNARIRNIVMHSADYVSEDFIKKNNRLGRSWGCPAIPQEDYDQVISWIKGKSLLFIYSSKRTQNFPSDIVNLAYVN